MDKIIDYTLEYMIAPKSLISVSKILHDKKKLGVFSSERAQLDQKALDFKKAHNIGFWDWGQFVTTIESHCLITDENISLFYDKEIDNNSEDGNNNSESNYKQEAPSILSIKKILTQPKSRKYSGYSNLDLNDLSNEIESFYSNQKFGWLGEGKPTVVVSNNEEGAIIRCYTAKSIVRTWGNSSETAVNVTIEENNDTIEFNCGFTGNKGVLSGSSIAGALLTGGVSLVGNAASAVKDGKLVNASMEFIDDMMKNQFSKGSFKSHQSSQELDIPSQIKKLSVLRDEGILTDDEFNSKKSDLLSKM